MYINIEILLIFDDSTGFKVDRDQPSHYLKASVNF